MKRFVYSIIIPLLCVMIYNPVFCEESTNTSKNEARGEAKKNSDNERKSKETSDKNKVTEKNNKQGEKRNKKKPDILFLDAQKTIKVDIKKKTLEIPAKAKTTKGFIELALGSVYAQNCRSHESIFITECKPSLIHAGLQLIGLKNGECVDFNGQKKIPSGAGLFIYVSWKEKDKKTGKENETVSRLEKLIYNNLTYEPVINIKWIFTGSRKINLKNSQDSYYYADVEGTVVATWHCSSTVIDISLPEGDNDEVFSVYTKGMPSKGTKVTFIFSVNELQEKPPVER